MIMSYSQIVLARPKPDSCFAFLRRFPTASIGPAARSRTPGKSLIFLTMPAFGPAPPWVDIMEPACA